MVKGSFAASQKALRSYQWVQTVGLSIGGEEKVKQQYTCYYGAEGNLQKVPLAADAKAGMTPPPPVSYHQHPPRERQRGFFTP